MGVGIDDVAALAGVSTATVSRVFSAPELVLEGTRQKVMEAVARLGYELCGADRRYYGAYMPGEAAIYLARSL